LRRPRALGRQPPPGRRRCSRGARRAASGAVAISEPATLALPLVGTIVVVTIPTVVDLPAPFGPSRPNTSPAATSNSMPPGYRFESARTSIASPPATDSVPGRRQLPRASAVLSNLCATSPQ
jgi:hypothetical protein